MSRATIPPGLWSVSTTDGRMEGVEMTPEMIATISAMLAVLAATGGMFAWLHRHMDRRFDQAEARMEARFERVDARFEKVDERLKELATELTEVKITVARLEGPRPRLIPVR